VWRFNNWLGDDGDAIAFHLGSVQTAHRFRFGWRDLLRRDSRFAMSCFANAAGHRVSFVECSVSDAKRFSGYKKAQKGQNTNRKESVPEVLHCNYNY